ncbi:MAG: hypothetical protein E7388_00145 [Ruminococcaceae bacterium]|nr:hypothetical protein [Oscillospiraceae bacterium]
MKNTNLNEYATLSEASKRSRYSKKQIQKLAELGNERIRSKKLSNGHKLYNLIDILQYSSAHPNETILNPVWDAINQLEGEYFYPLFGYDYKYFLSNKGRIINATNGQVLTAQPRGKDSYKQVCLIKYGKSKLEYLHRLIALTQCPNSLFKDIVHHIKIHNPSIDKASNLIWVWKWQHDELHRLLKENKMEDYNKMVKKIKNENRQKIYKIPHLDFESDEHFNYFMFVTENGFRAYKESRNVPVNSIIKESAEAKEV